MSGVRRFAPEVVSPLMPLRTHADLQVEQNRMKLPARDELLRIVAAVGATLLVVALAVLFFRWVFSSTDREHRRVQPLAFSSSAERSRSISASWRSILRTSSPFIANTTMMAVKATENPINTLNRCLRS